LKHGFRSTVARLAETRQRNNTKAEVLLTTTSDASAIVLSAQNFYLDNSNYENVLHQIKNAFLYSLRSYTPAGLLWTILFWIQCSRQTPEVKRTIVVAKFRRRFGVAFSTLLQQ